MTSLSTGFWVPTFSHGRIVQIDFTQGHSPNTEKVRSKLQKLQRYSRSESATMRSASECKSPGNPAHWMRLDTGCDTALEWVVTGWKSVGRVKTESVSQACRLISSKLPCSSGKQYFNAVATVVRKEQIFPGEAGLLGNGLLSKFCLTIDQPGNRAILQKPM